MRRLDDRAVRPKAIFFSYGHDKNKELVELFKRDLEKRGHKIWFDAKEIGTWDDWRGKITHGIDSSNMAIAFVSRHSIRDPGVCRNEIAIAMNRFGTVYPVLLEAGIEKDIPVTISHLQWPDLSQWKDIRDGKVPDMDWNHWYEEKLFNLIEKLEGEATRFADETRVLQEVLQPSSFEAQIAQHVPGFIGRKWIFDAYTDWLEHQPESRLFWIKAGPGVGKSAIAANLAHRQRGAIVASWFCDSKSGELNDPDKALKSLAFQLALRWEDFRVRLLRKLQLTANTTDDICDEARKALAKKNTHDLFLFLLAEPMAGLIWREHKLVVVIDALDEATDEQGNNRITELIGKELDSLPPWIGFVVTSRPEADVVNRLGGFKPFELDAHDPRNISDLRIWYQEALGQRTELSELPDAERQRIEGMLIDRSEGMILYLKVIEKSLKEGSVTVSKLEQLESGLPGLYALYYDSFKHRFGNDYEISIKPLLRLLHAAGGPLPEDLACEVLGWNSEQFLSCRNRLGSYVIETSTGYELFHKTLGEWLGDKSTRTFYLDRVLGRQLIADVLFKEIKKQSHLVRWRVAVRAWLPAWLLQLSQYWEPTALDTLGWILLDYADYSTARSLYERALDIRKAALPAGHPDIAASLNNLADLFTETGGYNEAERLYCEALAIFKTALPAGHPRITTSLNNLADLLECIGRYDEAEPLFREALALLKTALPKKPPHIARCLQNLAKLLQATNRYDEAERLYFEALAIYKTAPKGHPDIALCLQNLASLHQTVGRYDEAERLYLEALAIVKVALPAGHPNIAASLTNLALLYTTTGRYEEAEPLCREALEICNATLPAEHPDTAGSLISLAKLLQATSRYEEAEPRYRKALAIFKTVLPAGHRLISASLAGLGNLLATTGRYVEAEPLYREALAINTTTLLEGHPDIAKALNNLSVLLRTTGHYDEAELFCREALAIYKAAPKVHRDITFCLNNLNQLLQATGRYDEAEACKLESTRFLANISKECTSNKPITRNASCPCGSGKRYKHCHGQIGE